MAACSRSRSCETKLFPSARLTLQVVILQASPANRITPSASVPEVPRGEVILTKPSLPSVVVVLGQFV